MSESMVERVARAMFEKHRIGERAWPVPEAEVYRLFAATAIEAMREPTEAMIDASNQEWDGRMSHRSSSAWRAMIDAALANGIEADVA